MRWWLLVLWALSAEADFFQLDSISNVSTYYFNYFYCNIWEGDCQPHQDDASQQGKRGAHHQKKHTKIIVFLACDIRVWLVRQFLPETLGQAFLRTT